MATTKVNEPEPNDDPSSASVVGTSGMVQGLRYRLSTHPCLIGRVPDCNIPISERSVSRQHCKIERREGHYWLEDLGSLNGTWVNGSRVQQHELATGDRITVGISEFVFNMPGDTVESEMPRPEVDNLVPRLISTQPLKD